MKIFTKYIKIKTEKRIEIIKITNYVKNALEESGINEGICLINPMHVTSSVFINDDEEGLKKDFKSWLENLVPYDKKNYFHNLTGEDNAYAHLRRTIMGRETVVAVTRGDLDLGTWEEIFYFEFDGQREKTILIKIMGE